MNPRPKNSPPSATRDRIGRTSGPGSTRGVKGSDRGPSKPSAASLFLFSFGSTGGPDRSGSSTVSMMPMASLHSPLVSHMIRSHPVESDHEGTLSCHLTGHDRCAAFLEAQPLIYCT